MQLPTRSVKIESDDHWRALRHEHVGGSEVATLFDVDPRQTKFDLWHRKKGNLPEPDLDENERVMWGNVLEPAIARGVSSRTGWLVKKARRYFEVHSTAMGATPDYFAYKRGDKPPAVVQIKNVDRLVANDWIEDEPPAHMQVQLQHEIACTGKKAGVLAVLIGGNDLRLFDYDRHDGVIDRINTEVGAFWLSLAEGEEPDPDPQRDLDALAALYRDFEPKTFRRLDENARLEAACRNYVRARRHMKRLEGLRDQASFDILKELGRTANAFCGDYRIKSTAIEETPVSYIRSGYRRITVKHKPNKWSD